MEIDYIQYLLEADETREAEIRAKAKEIVDKVVIPTSEKMIKDIGKDLKDKYLSSDDMVHWLVSRMLNKNLVFKEIPELGFDIMLHKKDSKTFSAMPKGGKDTVAPSIKSFGGKEIKYTNHTIILPVLKFERDVDKSWFFDLYGTIYFLNSVKDTSIFHEVIHILDFLSWKKNPYDIRTGRIAKKEPYLYDPGELNAWLRTGIQGIDLLKQGKMLIGKTWEEFFDLVIESSFEHLSMCEIKRRVGEVNWKKLVKRIYDTYLQWKKEGYI